MILCQISKAYQAGRILANAGTEWKSTTYVNCFVGPLPSEDLDSINSIYKVLVDQANTLKSEGRLGNGFLVDSSKGFIH